MLISVWIEVSQPLAGTAAIEEASHCASTGGGSSFLRVVSELVDSAPASGGAGVAESAGCE